MGIRTNQASGVAGSGLTLRGMNKAQKAETCKGYQIRQGDTLSEIAARVGVSLNEIKKLNPGINPKKIQPGQVIKMPYNATTDRGDNRCHIPTGVRTYDVTDLWNSKQNK